MTSELNENGGGSPRLAKPGEENRRIAIAILLAALVFGGTLRILTIVGKATISGDEALSYLAATGHQAEYSRNNKAQERPYGTWVNAAEWKRFVQPEKVACFGTISTDLGATDRHPPLYFWLLHVWLLVVGVHLWTGPALNVALAMLGVICLFGLVREALGRWVPAAAAAFLWSVSPMLVLGSSQAVQYDLLTLLTILFVWQLLRLCDPDRSAGLRQLGLLAVVTTFGLLTHYGFAYLVGTGAIFTIARCWKRGPALWLRTCGALAISFAALAALHPSFYTSLQRLWSRNPPFGFDYATSRAPQLLTRYASFFVDSVFFGKHPARQSTIEYCTLAILGLLLAILIVRYGWKLARTRSAWSRFDLGAVSLVWFFVSMVLVNVGLYLTGQSGGAAMGIYYPTLVWPFLAIIPPLALQLLGKGRLVLMFMFLAVTLGFGGHRTCYEFGVEGYARWPATMDPTDSIESAERIIADRVSRRFFTRMFFHFPDDVKVFAADRDFLLSRTDQWLDDLAIKDLYMTWTTVRRGKEPPFTFPEIVTAKYPGVSHQGGVWRVGVFLEILEVINPDGPPGQ